METEQQDFIKFAKDQRNKFAGEIRETFVSMSTKDRVSIEDLLIAYDQLVECCEHAEQYKAKWISPEQIIEILKYMNGYTDFPGRKEGEGLYYWRKILRDKFEEIGVAIPTNTLTK